MYGRVSGKGKIYNFDISDKKWNFISIIIELKMEIIKYDGSIINNKNKM